FNEWSSKSAKYEGFDACAAKWNSFRSDAKNAVTLGSLMRETVAAISDFPLSEPVAAPPAGSPPAEGVAAPPATAAEADWETVKQLLEPRLVFVRSQDSYFDMWTHAEG